MQRRRRPQARLLAILAILILSTLTFLAPPARAHHAIPPDTLLDRWERVATAAIWDGCTNDGNCQWPDPAALSDALVLGVYHYDQLPEDHMSRFLVRHATKLVDASPGGVVLRDRYPLPCIRRYESGGDYVAWSGYYAGAYQFDSSTWSGAVVDAGYVEWRHNRFAPPHVQDAAAWELYLRRGLQPWPTPNRLC